jgi:hypothetical protein
MNGEPSPPGAARRHLGDNRRGARFRRQFSHRRRLPAVETPHGGLLKDYTVEETVEHPATRKADRGRPVLKLVAATMGAERRLLASSREGANEHIGQTDCTLEPTKTAAGPPWCLPRRAEPYRRWVRCFV